LDLAKHLSLLDFEAGSIVSGAKFYYSFNEAVRARQVVMYTHIADKYLGST